MKSFISCVAAAFLSLMPIAPVYAATTESPVVLELFTSQGCSSCPSADKLLKRLSDEDPSILPLSLHVHYWDYLGWKDPYSSASNTERQKSYVQALNGSNLFTPQLIVNGQQSLVGSQESAVRKAVIEAKRNLSSVKVVITPNAAGDLVVDLSGDSGGVSANVLLISFDHFARTSVANGENAGEVLENTNNVTHIEPLGTWLNSKNNYVIPRGSITGDGVAVIVQAHPQGRVLGAASYVKP